LDFVIYCQDVTQCIALYVYSYKCIFMKNENVTKKKFENGSQSVKGVRNDN